MAMLTSAFAYLGSYYSEANPSLQGKDSVFPDDVAFNRDFIQGRLCLRKETQLP